MEPNESQQRFGRDGLHSVEDIISFLKSYQRLGGMITENGTVLIGKAIHIAPEAWLHHVFPPLSEEQIAKLADAIGMTFPKEYHDFLRVSNGLDVFSGTLALYGMRSCWNRTVEETQQQPFDIIDPNGIERPPNTEQHIVIGSYSWDGSVLAIHSEQGSVIVCDRESGDISYRWASFNLMLCDEVWRISNLFDTNGKEIDPDKSSVPYNA